MVYDELRSSEDGDLSSRDLVIVETLKNYKCLESSSRGQLIGIRGARMPGSFT